MKYIVYILVFTLLTTNIFSEEIYGKITRIEGERVIIDLGEEAGMREGMLVDVLTKECTEKDIPCIKIKLIRVYRLLQKELSYLKITRQTLRKLFHVLFLRK